MNEDAITTPETIAAVTQIITAGATVIAASAAVFGLRTWRRQIAGQASYELARRMLRNIYLYKDTLLDVKKSWWIALKGVSLERLTSENLSFRLPDTKEKIALLQTIKADLEVDAIEAKVIWGIDTQEDLKPLQGLGGLTIHQVENLQTFCKLDHSSIVLDESFEAITVDMWEMNQLPNLEEFQPALEEHVKWAERRIRKYLKPPTKPKIFAIDSKV